MCNNFISNQYYDLKSSLSSCQSSVQGQDFQGPVVYVLPIIEDFLQRLNQPSVAALQLEMARWALENKQYSNFFLYLCQAVLTQTYDLLEDRPFDRQSVKASKRADERLRRLKGREGRLGRMVDLYEEANSFRNHVAHPGTNKLAHEPSYYIAKAPDYLKVFEEIAFKGAENYARALNGE